MEVALDFAIQAAPDHPWVREHPEWFRFRPDGTIKYAENPPKKYEDIVNVDFDNPDREGLWAELRDTILFWVDEGVRTFRVDNPHTKPLPFWEWLIREVKARCPEAIFLSEAFTRPKMMRALAKAGFTQSYTYFTWRNTKSELIEYLTELTSYPAKEYFRPNFFTNTPDILPVFLQEGGRPAFRIRLVLAATLSPVYGIYNGFELCENTPIPGREEYLHSEKYEYKVWDWDRPGNIKEDIAVLNRFRRNNPAYAGVFQPALSKLRGPEHSGLCEDLRGPGQCRDRRRQSRSARRARGYRRAALARTRLDGRCGILARGGIHRPRRCLPRRLSALPPRSRERIPRWFSAFNGREDSRINSGARGALLGRARFHALFQPIKARSDAQ